MHTRVCVRLCVYVFHIFTRMTVGLQTGLDSNSLQVLFDNQSFKLVQTSAATNDERECESHVAVW